ncbi:MAG TPA: diguanylate cyclase [Pyrinomonadaceae bacterium]|nr:diguanylate cyclase [Pyrinomonadaceae bacterium]
MASTGLTMSARAEKRNTARTTERARGRVLLIADDDQTRFVEAITARGINVVGVANGAAAMVSLQRSRPHVVVANPSARGLGIRELAKMLARSDDGIPLVLAGSQPATLDVRHAALLEGAFDYFELPLELELLIERTQQLVAVRQKIDQLRSDADLDSLTGLANRRRFRVALSREVERWRRYRVPCALLMLDIDHLKRINDQFGHPAGDAVIRQIAQTLKEVSRDNDTAARLGGEEFALLLAGVDMQKAAAAAERLRTVLSGRPVEGVGTVTVSIGVAACPENAPSERTLYVAGDRALYVSKNSGRDRVSVAPPLQEKLPGV